MLQWLLQKPRNRQWLVACIGLLEPGWPQQGKPQGPPEIYSDTQFPSLQSTAKHVERRKDKEMEKSFEVVTHKTRGRDEFSKNQALKLQLDNQYAVLENQKSSHTQYN